MRFIPNLKSNSPLAEHESPLQVFVPVPVWALWLTSPLMKASNFCSPDIAVCIIKANPCQQGKAGPEGPGLGWARRAHGVGGVGWGGVGGGATEVRGASRQEPNAEATSAE